MKSKSPICPNCHKPMKAFYTKRSFKLDKIYKRYWQKEGYICNHIYKPMIILTLYKEYSKNKQNNYMIGIYDIETIKLVKALRCFNYKELLKNI